MLCLVVLFCVGIVLHELSVETVVPTALLPHCAKKIMKLDGGCSQSGRAQSTMCVPQCACFHMTVCLFHVLARHVSSRLHVCRRLRCRQTRRRSSRSLLLEFQSLLPLRGSAPARIALPAHQVSPAQPHPTPPRVFSPASWCPTP